MVVARPGAIAGTGAGAGLRLIDHRDRQAALPQSMAGGRAPGAGLWAMAAPAGECK